METTATLSFMDLPVEMSFMDLPVEMIDKILSYLSYDQIAKARAVNRTFNNICSNRLNNGFVALEKFHRKCLKAVKSRLPRRESERKRHPLARHCDVLMAVETRFSMLSMTFTKYIETRQCCFIPGKVLDEAFRVLRIVNNSTSFSTDLQSNLPRPYEFLQEYRDISSMAMEHFDDKILPTIREQMRLVNLAYCKPLLLSKLAMKTNFLQTYKELKKNTKKSSEHATDSNLCKVLQPGLKIVKIPPNTTDKCNSARKALGVLQRNMIMETNKLKIENIMLKRKCGQLEDLTKRMRKDLTETKSVVSILAKDLNQLKSKSPSTGLRSKREGANNTTKMYKLLHNTNVKLNSTCKTVEALNRNMKFMAKRIRTQERLLRSRISKEDKTTSRTTVMTDNDSYNSESCSTLGMEWKITVSEEKMS